MLRSVGVLVRSSDTRPSERWDAYVCLRFPDTLMSPRETTALFLVKFLLHVPLHIAPSPTTIFTKFTLFTQGFEMLALDLWMDSGV